MRMMITKHRLPFLLLFLLVGGCGDDKKEAGQIRTDSENPFKVQMDTIKQAREVEQLVQVQAAQRHQLIEDQIKR